MIDFFETKFKINLSDINQIEDLVKLKFPEEYKQHLLNYNGGYCNKSIFSFLENSKISNSNVDWFLAIYDGKHNNLKRYIEIYKLEQKRLPSHIIPIAHDSGGNLICISCGKSDYGQIFFWDHENEVNYKISNDDDYSNLFLIAKSFNEFINDLRENI